MKEEMDRVILNLVQFGILDKLFKDYDFTTPNDGAEKKLHCSGANPTIVSYNASVVKIYNGTGSLLRFENKDILLLHYERRSSPQRWLAL
jgi:hypothetical protein